MFRLPDYGTLAFVALVPILAVARCGSTGATILAGTMTGWVAYATFFAWLPWSWARLGALSFGTSCVLVLAGVVVHGLQLGVFGAAAGCLAAGANRRRSATRIAMLALGWPAAWVLVEWVYPMAFPWSLGEALAAHRLLRQAADLGGAHGLAFAIVAVNGAVAFGLEHGRAARERAAALTVAAAIVVLLAVYGAWAVGRFGGDLAGRDLLRVGLVQGAVPAQLSRGEGAADRAWGIYEPLTDRIAAESGGIDVVLWPETTLDTYPRDDAWTRERLERLAARTRSALVVGAPDRIPGEPDELNAAFLFAAGGRDSAPSWLVHHKSALLAWAEYVPGAAWLPALRAWRTTGEYRAGAGALNWTVEMRSSAGSLRIGPSICSEALYPGWFNPLVREGGSLLINLTDDAWFAGTPDPSLHLHMMRLRAVETRRWLVRASNSGISAVIAPTGDIVASLPFGVRGTLVQRIEPRHDLTPYVRGGEWPVVMSALVLFWNGWLRRRSDVLERVVSGGQS